MLKPYSIDVEIAATLSVLAPNPTAAEALINGVYEAHVCDGLPASFPSVRPHYE